MNIPVLTYRGHVVVRPDQTYRHGQDSLYVPENVDSISWSPAIFLHICKPGRCIASRFASRHYDSLSYGVLLYPESLIGADEESYASAICLNGTTYFAEFGDCPSELRALGPEGEELFSSGFPGKERIAEAVEQISLACHLRTGDIPCLELAQRSLLCSRKDSCTELRMGEVRLSIIF